METAEPALAAILCDSTVEVVMVALDGAEANIQYAELKELLLILGIPSLGAIYLLKYLRDDSSVLRIKALQVLARERLSFALKPVLALVDADDFQERPFAEKKEIYQALGDLGQERMIPMARLGKTLVSHFFVLLKSSANYGEGTPPSCSGRPTSWRWCGRSPGAAGTPP